MFDEIVTLITNVGFPIACCVVLFMRMGDLAKEVTQKLNPGADTKQYHIVVKGDRLSKIAKKYGTTVDWIMLYNPFIKDPNKIQIGWEVRVR